MTDDLPMWMWMRVRKRLRVWVRRGHEQKPVGHHARGTETTSRTVEPPAC